MNIKELISARDLSEFLHLAPKSIRPLLILPRVQIIEFDSFKKSYMPVALGSRDSTGKPNGLLVAEVCLDNDQNDVSLAKLVDIKSLYVDKLFRNQRIAENLINALCDKCSKWPNTSINIIFPKNQASSSFLEKLTDQSKGWKSNKTINYVTIDDCQLLHSFVKRCDNVGLRLIKKFNLAVECLSDSDLDEIQLTAEKNMLEAWTLPSSINDFILPKYSRTLRIGKN